MKLVQVNDAQRPSPSRIEENIGLSRRKKPCVAMWTIAAVEPYRAAKRSRSRPLKEDRGFGRTASHRPHFIRDAGRQGPGPP